MREIKYKAWCSERKLMCEVISINFEEDTITVKYPDGHRCTYKLSLFILMQYTGLKDKNGKEIFEGDVIKDNDGDIRTIQFVNGSFGGRLTLVPHLALLIDEEMYNCEIIGNRFENPELLQTNTPSV
jgi:uncharacterized phage protein (TIGR01671 family)